MKQLIVSLALVLPLAAHAGFDEAVKNAPAPVVVQPEAKQESSEAEEEQVEAQQPMDQSAASEESSAVL